MSYGQCDAASHALNLVEGCPHEKEFRAVKTGFESSYSIWQPNGSLVFVCPSVPNDDLLGSCSCPQRRRRMTGLIAMRINVRRQDDVVDYGGY